MSDLLARLQGVWDGIQNNEMVFWLTIGGLLLLILVLLLLLFRNARRRRNRRPGENHEPVLFVPVDADKDTAEIFLPLSAKLTAEAALRDKVSPELLSKIRDYKPQCLEEILQVIGDLPEKYADDLRRIIREEQMLLLYTRTLGRAEYQSQVLAVAYLQCPDPALLPEFVELLASHNEGIQMAAVKLLTTLNDPQSLPYLASALLQPQRYVPARVAEVLIAMGESAAWLLAYLLHEVDSDSRPLVLSVLGQMQVEYPLEPVFDCLQDPTEQTRRSAVVALGEHGQAAACLPLASAAGDEKWSVRAAIGKALGQIGDLQALPVLEQLALDENWMVSANARESLRHLKAKQATG